MLVGTVFDHRLLYALSDFTLPSTIDFMQIVGAIICGLVMLRLVQSITLARWVARHRQAHSKQALILLDERIASTTPLRVHQQEQSHWNGYRRFRVKQKVFETDCICSFYLVPHDEKPLPSFLPGQFLTFRFAMPGEKQGETKDIVRCYSLSDAPRAEQYRITVKRVPAADDASAPGLISSYLLDNVEQGALLDVRAPRGDFTVDMETSRPVVLIAGGIGITPLLSMANILVAKQSHRDVWLFYGVRNGFDHAMKEHLQQLAAARKSFHLSVAYSVPLSTDQIERDYDRAGRVTFGCVRDTITTKDCDFYVCGPSGMMNSIVPALKEWGVEPDRIHSEAFGPAAVSQQVATAEGPQSGVTDEQFSVEFFRSGQQHTWDSDSGSLLDLAERHGIPIDSGCRSGNCGSCEVAILSGRVQPISESTADCTNGSCLACVSIPGGALRVDA